MEFSLVHHQKEVVSKITFHSTLDDTGIEMYPVFENNVLIFSPLSKFHSCKMCCSSAKATSVSMARVAH